MKSENKKIGNCFHYLRICDDWFDFVEYVKKVNPEKNKNITDKFSCSSIIKGDLDWYGTESLEEAIILAEKGWPEGRKRIQNQKNNLSFQFDFNFQNLIEKVIDLSGDEPDIDLYLAGEPEHMATYQEQIVRNSGKIVKIAYEISASCDVEKNTITKIGAVICELICIMSKIGLSIEFEIHISSADRFNNAGNVYSIIIPVLHAGEPFNLDTFCFMTMHPSVLRRLSFAFCENESTEVRRLFGFYKNDGYGYPWNLEKEQDCDFKFDFMSMKKHLHNPQFFTEFFKEIGINYNL